MSTFNPKYKKNKLSIYFCFPYKKTGGISTLFLRLGSHIANNTKYNVCIIDFIDGYMATNNKNEKLKFIEYKQNQKTYIPENSIIIFQLMNPWTIFPNLKIHSNAKVVFWSCLPYNLIPHIPIIGLKIYKSPLLIKILLNTILLKHKYKNINFLNYLLSNKGIVFQDVINVNSLEKYFRIPIKNPTFLPIPIEIKKSSSTQFNHSHLRIVWIGRISDFKVHVLIRFLKDIDTTSKKLNLKILLTIVGDGEFYSLLKKEIKNLINIKPLLIKEIPTNEIKSFLRNNFDLAACMGTSALETSSMGIPTILLDISYKPLSYGYKYRWLHNEKGFTLGRIIDNDSRGLAGDNIENLINSFLKYSKQHSSDTLNYIKKNHDLKKISKNFIKAITEAETSWSEINQRGFLKKGFLYNTLVFFRKIW